MNKKDPQYLKGKRARTTKGKFVADDPSTPENEAWVKPKKRKTLWDIVLELKGTIKRKSFFGWLTRG